MKILLIPAHSSIYDYNMIFELSEALKLKGLECFPLRNPINNFTLKKLCETYNFDVVFQVNRFRPSKNILPKKIRHISWFQDVFPTTLKSNIDFLDQDILYTLGNKKLLGLEDFNKIKSFALYTGVNKKDLHKYSYLEKKYVKDFSLVGFIPTANFNIDISPKEFLSNEISELIRNIPFISNIKSVRLLNNYLTRINNRLINDLKSGIELNYLPLTGSLNIKNLEDIIFELLPYSKKYKEKLKMIQNEEQYKLFNPGIFNFNLKLNQFINWLVIDYPRYLDRILLVELANKVSNSITLYGKGWEHYPEYTAYYKGIIHNKIDLYKNYRNTKINLSNNNHGIGLHSRNLECMGIGGFIMYHKTVHDDMEGTLLQDFEPNKHFGQFTVDNFEEQAKFWIKNTKKRELAGELARKVVLKKHLWEHRAQQILKDMGK